MNDATSVGFSSRLKYLNLVVCNIPIHLYVHRVQTSIIVVSGLSIQQSGDWRIVILCKAGRYIWSAE